MISSQSASRSRRVRSSPVRRACGPSSPPPAMRTVSVRAGGGGSGPGSGVSSSRTVIVQAGVPAGSDSESVTAAAFVEFSR